MRSASHLKKTVRVKNLGRQRYADTLSIQQKLRNSHLNRTGRDTLLIVEHEPVYTLGRRDTAHDFKVDVEHLRKRGNDIEHTTRGGAITWHGPGQLVAYPILNLANYTKSARWYVHTLENTIVKTLHQFNIPAHTTSNVGVWVNDVHKIASIGIAISSLITMHGLALNVCNDLDAFTHIVPCGLNNIQITSVSKELKRKVTIDEVLPVLLQKFSEEFGVELEFDISDDQQLLRLDTTEQRDESRAQAA